MTNINNIATRISQRKYRRSVEGEKKVRGPINTRNDKLSSYSRVSVPVIELAQLSDAVYSCNRGSSHLKVKGWRCRDWDDNKNGLKTAWYKKSYYINSTDKIEVNVFAVAGTEDIMDLVVDMGLATGTLKNSPVRYVFKALEQIKLRGAEKIPTAVYNLITQGIGSIEDYFTNSQFRGARIAFEKYNNKTSTQEINIVTGHSLGGAIATYIAYNKGVKAVAFNSPGIQQTKAYKKIYNKDKRRVRAMVNRIERYVAEGDAVSTLLKYNRETTYLVKVNCKKPQINIFLANILKQTGEYFLCQHIMKTMLKGLKSRKNENTSIQVKVIKSSV